MKSLCILSLAAVIFVLSGCSNNELVSCQEENDLLSAQLEQVKGRLEKTTKAYEACQKESEEVQTKAMEAISTMMTKQQQADDKVKAKLEASEAKVEKLTKQLEGHKMLGSVLEGKMKEINTENKSLKTKVKELEGKMKEINTENESLKAKVKELEAKLAEADSGDGN